LPRHNHIRDKVDEASLMNEIPSYKEEQLIPSYRQNEPVVRHREVPQKDEKKDTIKKWDELLKQLDEPHKKEEKYKKWDDLYKNRAIPHRKANEGHKKNDFLTKKEGHQYKKWENMEKYDENVNKHIREKEKRINEDLYKPRASKEQVHKRPDPTQKHEIGRYEDNVRSKEDKKLIAKEDYSRQRRDINKDEATTEDELLQKAIAESLKDAQSYNKVPSFDKRWEGTDMNGTFYGAEAQRAIEESLKFNFKH